MTEVRILVIQLARLGDTLQSLMALKAAKKLYPQLKIHFVARTKFAQAAAHVDWLDGLYFFPSEEILGPILNGKKTKREMLPELASWIEKIAAQKWDIVLNWTYSPASSYLPAFLQAPIKLGYNRAPDGSLMCTDGWSQYIMGVVQGQVRQNIHLTDILTTQLLTALQIHVGEPVDAGEAAVTSKDFFKLGSTNLKVMEQILKSRRRVAIQIGAGRSDKIWPATQWARLVETILNRHPEWGIVILGGRDERKLEEEFWNELQCNLRDRRRVASAVGQCTFDQWVDLVRHCQWVIAGDTAVIHLASLVGTRVLNLSYGDVRAEETGPYGNGHYVIKTSSTAQELSAEAVYAAWSYASSEWYTERADSISEHFENLGCRYLLKDTQVYRSRIRPVDQGGGVVYEPLVEQSLTLETWLSMVMGHVARDWYCGWSPAVGAEIKREALDSKMIQALRQISESIPVFNKVCVEAMATCQRLHDIASCSGGVLNNAQHRDITDLGKKLHELDLLLDRLSMSQPVFLPFVQMLKVLMHNVQSKGLAPMCQESEQAYRQIAEGVQNLNDWTQYCLRMVKPKLYSSADPQVSPE